jgi:hypothetical protein
VPREREKTSPKTIGNARIEDTWKTSPILLGDIFHGSDNIFEMLLEAINVVVIQFKLNSSPSDFEPTYNMKLLRCWITQMSHKWKSCVQRAKERWVRYNANQHAFDKFQYVLLDGVVCWTCKYEIWIESSCFCTLKFQS